MLGTGSISLILPICQNLTSERAKERTESLARLKTLIIDRKQVQALSSNDINLVVASYFKMLAIEIKYTKELNPQLEARIRAILRDARILLTLCLPLTKFNEEIDTIVNTLLNILQTIKLQELATDAILVLNQLLSYPALRCSFAPNQMRHLLVFCRDRLIQAERGLDSECSKALYNLSNIFYEINQVDYLKEIMQISIALLSKESGQVIDSTCASFLAKSLNTSIKALTSSHPIFCRNWLVDLLESLDKPILRRKNVLDEIIDILSFSHHFLRHNHKLCDKVISFLVNDSHIGKYKIEEIIPLNVFPNDSIGKFLFVLAKYINPSLLLLPSMRRNHVSITSLIYFAHGLYHIEFKSIYSLETITEALFKSSGRDQLWLLSSFALLSNTIEISLPVLNFAEISLGRPLLSQAAAHLLKKRKFYIVQITEKLFFGDIDVVHLELLINNFLTRYSAILWSQSAAKELSKTLEFLYAFITEDPKQTLFRLFSVAPIVLKTLLPLIRDHLPLIELVSLFWNGLKSSCDELSNEHLLHFFRSKFKNPTLNFDQASKFLRVKWELITILTCYGANYPNFHIPWNSISCLPSFCLFLMNLLKPFIKGIQELAFCNILNLQTILSPPKKIHYNYDIEFGVEQSDTDDDHDIIEVLIEAYDGLCLVSNDELDPDHQEYRSNLIVNLTSRLREKDPEYTIEILERLPKIFENDLPPLSLLLDDLQRRAPSELFLKLFLKSQFTNLFPQWWTAFDSFYIPVSSRKLMVKLGQVLGKIPSFIYNEETCLEVLQLTTNLDHTTELSNHLIDIDAVPAALQKLKLTSQNYGEFILSFNQSVNHLDDFDFKDNLFEVLAILSSIFPNPESLQLAFDFVKAQGSISFLVNKVCNQTQPLPSPWSTIENKSNFGFLIARLLIENSLSTSPENIATKLHEIETCYERSELHELLKTNFFEILASILLLGNIQSIPQEKINQVLEQCCLIMKLEWLAIKKSTLIAFICLCLAKMAIHDYCSRLSLAKIIKCQLEGGLRFFQNPLGTCLCHVAQVISSSSTFNDEKTQWSYIHSKLALSPAAAATAANTLGDYDDDANNNNNNLGTIEVELAKTLCSLIETTPDPDIAIIIFKKLSSIQSSTFKSIENVPWRLRWAYFDQKSLKSLLKIRYKPKDSPPSNSPLFDDVLAVTNEPTVLKAISPWILVEALTKNQVLEDFTLFDADALSTALLYCNQQGIPIKLSLNNVDKIIAPPLEKLYILECLDSPLQVDSHYEEAYRQLAEWDYVEFIQGLQNNLPSLEFHHGNQNNPHLSLKISSLATIDWNTCDVPMQFNPEDSDDQLYAKLWTCIKARKILEPSDNVSILQKLAIACANSIVDAARVNTELVKACHEIWMMVKRIELTPQLTMMVQALEKVKKQFSANEDIISLLTLSKSTILSKMGQQERALRLVGETLKLTFAKLTPTKPTPHPLSLPSEYSLRLLLRASRWAWKLRCSPAEEIQRQYFDKLPSLDLIPIHMKSKVCYTLGKFFDEQFESLWSGDQIKTKRHMVRRTQKELDTMNSFAGIVKPKDEASFIKIKTQLTTQIEQDTLELGRIVKQRDEYALRALNNYKDALTFGDKYDVLVARFYSLWLAYRKSRRFNQVIISALPTLPLYKFIPLMYQLGARLDSMPDGDGFQTALHCLILELLKQYPNHVIYQLLNLKAATFDSYYRPTNTGGGGGSKRKLVDASGSQERRAQAARSLISQAKSITPHLNQLINDTERLWQAYSELAATELPSNMASIATQSNHLLDKKWQIGKISNLICPVPTSLKPPTSSRWTLTCDNDEMFPTVYSFGEGFKVIGGINLPKVIECIGSDGRRYRQLVKGKDDVRQDAVMEQVFRMVNQILSKETSTRNLWVRTFRVIPLQPLAGLLEWVEDAVPIGDYLGRAHEKYYPGDLSPKDARMLMKREFDNPQSTIESKYQFYCKEICARFHPVMERFFFETSPSTVEWFNRRAAYIRSASVNSMVGYVVGLGDRHCQNILLDRRTGELVHIDLNMIFDLGRTLRIPELVPFRLTRDIVHGMGAHGLGGPFTAHAIRTMSVLRERYTLVWIIMEVFRHDPLYRWTGARAAFRPDEWRAYLACTVVKDDIDKDGVDRNEDEDSLGKDGTTGDDNDGIVGGGGGGGGGNKEAERALFRVKEKLLGIEEGTPLSAIGQVSYLINMATDERLLSQMYPGWQPWM